MPSTSEGRGAGPPRVALVHDFLLDLRGAERVFLAMCDVWPDADIFTAVYNEEGTEGRFAHRNVHSSFLQRLGPTAKTFRAMLPLYPAAIESFEIYDFALGGARASPRAHAKLSDERSTHVCYCHNPFRYAWSDRDRTLSTRSAPTRAILDVIFRRWRQWDWIAAQRVDRYITNSRTTQARIRNYWNRDSVVVYPPVETGRFSPGEVGQHYMVLSELMPHKRIDVAIHAFNKLGLPLVVCGDGPDARSLRRIAGPTIQFVGRVSDPEAARLLNSSRALVVAAVEEFGIAAVEAQAAGRPVIAVRGGGTLETVVDGETGCFWSGGPDELAAVVAGFDDAAIDPQACVRNAARFDTSIFKRDLPRHVESALNVDDAPAPRRTRPVLRTARLARRAGL
jgi:glycosyltransferase involved in cell wall biosynthesis